MEPTYNQPVRRSPIDGHQSAEVTALADETEKVIDELKDVLGQFKDEDYIYDGDIPGRILVGHDDSFQGEIDTERFGMVNFTRNIGRDDDRSAQTSKLFFRPNVDGRAPASDQSFYSMGFFNSGDESGPELVIFESGSQDSRIQDPQRVLEIATALKEQLSSAAAAASKYEVKR